MTSLTNKLANEKPDTRMARVVRPNPARTPSVIIADEDFEAYLAEKPLVNLTIYSPVEKIEEEPVITMDYIKSYLAEKPLPKPTLSDCLRYASKPVPVYSTRKPSYGAVNVIRRPDLIKNWNLNENTVRLTKSDYKEAPKTLAQKFLSILKTRIF